MDAGSPQSSWVTSLEARWSRALTSRLLLPAVLLIAFAVYAPTLNDWFSGDDFWFLRSSQTSSVADYTRKAFDFRQTGSLPEFDRYRPLYPVVWRLEYAAFGLNAFGYHAVLVGLHLANVALVWFIALRLTKLRWAAGLAALIFAVHPAYADAVTWLSGGNRAFATLPYLAGLLLFMKYAAGGSRRRAYYIGSLLAFLTAILLHSSALTLVAVLTAYSFLVSGRPKDALRARAWLPIVPFVAVALALAGIQVWVRTHLQIEEQFRFGWHQYSVYGRYLGFALIPATSGDTSQLADPLPRVVTALQGLASVALLVLSIGLLARRRWPYLGVFVILWFYVSLLPDSTLLFPVMGRVLYLPGASLAILLVAAILWGREALPDCLVRVSARAAPLLVVAVLVPISLWTAYHSNSISETAARNEALVTSLRNELPALDSSAVLYVVGAPTNVVVFDDTRLDALVELYYGELDVRSLPAPEAEQVESSLGSHDRVFRFRP